MFYFLDLFGTAVFALSGVLAAKEKRLDWYGGLVLALVTAIGGGTFRDLVLGRVPVFWINDNVYIWIALATGVLSFPFLSKIIVNRWLLWSDAFGLGLFTVIGCQIAIDSGMSATVAILMGVATGTFGGMIRDILCGQAPFILKQEIYATASILGGVLYWIFAEELDQEWVGMILCISVVTLLRILAIEKNWRLPKLNH